MTIVDFILARDACNSQVDCESFDDSPNFSPVVESVTNGSGQIKQVQVMKEFKPVSAHYKSFTPQFLAKIGHLKPISIPSGDTFELIDKVSEVVSKES